MAIQYYEGIGRRKESTARVRLMSGSGRFVVNDKTAEVYFLVWATLQMCCLHYRLQVRTHHNWISRLWSKVVG